MREDNEPSLEDVDDYNNKESPEKRRIIWLVVLLCLAVGGIFAMFKTGSPKNDILNTLPKADAKK